MEDVTDPSFRHICKKFGADMVYTEFISSDGLIRDGAKSVKKLDIFDHERPIGIQLYGHDIASMVEATHIAVNSRPELIDLNYGCPVRKIANRGAGAGMLQNIPHMMEMTRAVVGASSLPVTAKTRLGWDDSSKNIVSVAEELQDCGIRALTIHGRTRAQFYKGTADWTLIGEVKRNPRMHIPIIGNGDVDSPHVAREMFKRYGVDGIMIGRGAVGRPWLFRDIRHFLKTGELLPDLTIAEKVSVAEEQFTKSLEWKSAPVGVYEMRRHFSNYFKGIPNFRETRIRLLTALEPTEIFSILSEISNTWGDLRTNNTTHFWSE
jgi:tRNA-dihydrouridine synthase B